MRDHVDGAADCRPSGTRFEFKRVPTFLDRIVLVRFALGFAAVIDVDPAVWRTLDKDYSKRHSNFLRLVMKCAKCGILARMASSGNSVATCHAVSLSHAGLV
jgi:hypothetical protein